MTPALNSSPSLSTNSLVRAVQQNLFLSIALASSFLLHGVLIGAHFVYPPASPAIAADPGLEVILVNAKHNKAPINAQAIAQANLDGGGDGDEGRAKSPLPDSGKIEDGESVKVSAKKIEELEDYQRRVLEQLKSDKEFLDQKLSEKYTPDEPSKVSGQDKVESKKALQRRIAEIAQAIEEQNKRPRKTYITPSTREAGYALYYKAMQKKIEDIGTLNFPQKDGNKLYGELIVYIPIYQDGNIYVRGGGPKIEKSSGNRALDAAALRIVRNAAPFGKFPANMRSKDKDDLWVVVTRFNFTRDQQLETELRGVAK
jgi:periplasmic protein TonB